MIKFGRLVFQIREISTQDMPYNSNNSLENTEIDVDFGESKSKKKNQETNHSIANELEKKDID